MATVVMGFIITNKGDVVAPNVISSDHNRFSEAAIRAVEKWRFRPGYKGGRAVNTRTQISIYFKVTTEK
jgi:protein TonB